MKARYRCERVIDAAGGTIMPGLVCSHHHLYSTFARGMALKAPPPSNFREILERLWWRLDKALTMDDIYISSLIPLIECIRAGTTTIFDHHAGPNAIEGSLSEIERAVLDAGIRASLCYEVSDRNGRVGAREGIRENVRFIRHCKEMGSPLLKAHFGLHASFTLSDETLKECREAIPDPEAGFHIHCAEDHSDVDHAINRHGMRVVSRLKAFDLLRETTILAHCIHLNEEEMDIIRESGATAVYNPQSNMNNAVGAARVLTMLSKGIPLNLGTDGMTGNMLEEMRAGFLLQRHESGDPSSTFAEVPSILLENNALFATRIFGVKSGKLLPGYGADIAVFDYIPATPLSGENLYGHLLYSLYGARVMTTVCNGKVLMHRGEFPGLDIDSIYARGRELARRVWARF